MNNSRLWIAPLLGLLLATACRTTLAGETIPKSTIERGLLQPVNIFSPDLSDTRLPQSRSGVGQVYAPVGIIVPNDPIPITHDGSVLSKDVRATAFLVSPCFILTNYHAVFGIAKGGVDPLQVHSASFYVGEDLITGFKYKVRAVPVLHGDSGTAVSEDWVLLKLDKCAGASPDIGWLQMPGTSLNDYSDQPLYLVGFPGEHNGKVLYAGGPCKITPVDISGAVEHDCPMTAGESGAPIVAKLSDGNITVIAINQGDTGDGESNPASPLPPSKIYREWDQAHTNIGIDAAALMLDPRFGQLIEHDIESWNVTNGSLVASVNEDRR